MFKIQYLVLNEGQAVSNEYVDTEFEYKDFKDAEKKRIELQDYYTDSRWYRIVKFVENV
jgi:hypothetical protein